MENVDKCISFVNNYMKQQCTGNKCLGQIEMKILFLYRTRLTKIQNTVPHKSIASK